MSKWNTALQTCFPNKQVIVPIKVVLIFTCSVFFLLRMQVLLRDLFLIIWVPWTPASDYDVYLTNISFTFWFSMLNAAYNKPNRCWWQIHALEFLRGEMCCSSHKYWYWENNNEQNIQEKPQKLVPGTFVKRTAWSETVCVCVCFQSCATSLFLITYQ